MAAHQLGARLRQFSFGLVLLGAGLGPLAPTQESTFALRLIIEVFFILAGALWLISQSFEGRIRLVTGRLGVPLLLLFAGLICATINASYHFPALLTLLSWTAALAAFLVVLNECRSRTRRVLLILTIGAAAFITALHGLHQIAVELPSARSAFSSNEGALLKALNISPDMAGDFRGRLDKNRVFSTFLIANSFAGFLVLVIPALLGYLLDGWQAQRRRQTILGAVLLMPILIAFLATGSKGGYVALAVGLLIFGLWAARDVIRRKRMQFACAILGILVVVAIAQMSGLLPPLRDYVGSSSVRYGYWRAGGRIVMDHPLVGVGLDNFADYYPSEKRPEDQEVRRAHNDYIQMFAEGGVILIGTYALFLFLYWRRVLKRSSELLLPSDAFFNSLRSHVGPIIALAAGVFFLEAVCGGTLRSMTGNWGWYWIIALCDCWILFMLAWLQNSGEYPFSRSSAATLGIACGLVAFLIHSLADFNHYVGGTLQTAWILMALLLAARQSEEQPEANKVDRALSPTARLAFFIVPAAIALYLLYGFSVKLIESNALVEEARDFSVVRTVEARERDLKNAAAGNPWDAHTRALLSDLYANMWRSGQARTYEGPSTISQAINYAQQAVAIDPVRSEYWTRLGRLHEARWLALSDPEDFRAALAAFSRAEELFPSNPDTALNHARLLDELGAGGAEEAAGKYRSAVSLSNQEQYNATQRKFSDDELKELNQRITQLTAAYSTGSKPPALLFRSPRLYGWPTQ